MNKETVDFNKGFLEGFNFATKYIIYNIERFKLDINEITNIYNKYVNKEENK